MLNQNLKIPLDKIKTLCNQYPIRKIAIFGSALRDDFETDSDIDVLVEFEPDAEIGLEFITIQDELSEILGRPVDLNTPDFLSPHFRDKVLTSAEVIYERAR